MNFLFLKLNRKVTPQTLFLAFKAQWIHLGNFELLQCRGCPVLIRVQLKMFWILPTVTLTIIWNLNFIPLFANIEAYMSGSLNKGLYPLLWKGDLFQLASMISFTLGIELCRLKSPIPGNLRPKASSHQMTMPKNLIWISNIFK